MGELETGGAAINFETLQLDSPDIPELCREKYRALLGAWPAPGQMDDRAAVWAMTWLSKPDASAVASQDWAECQRIADLPSVDEALLAFAENMDNDNAVHIVRAVLEARHG